MAGYTREQYEARLRGESVQPTAPPSPGCCGGLGKLAAKIAGGLKLAAVDFGIMGETPEPLREARQAACTACEHFDFGICRDCGCVLWAKVRIASEDCPRGLWPTVEGKQPPPT